MNRIHTLSLHHFLILILIVFGALSRFLPHPPNFTAVGAIALFAGATLSSTRMAILFPIAIMFITDLFIGLHGTMIAVYLAMVLVSFMGKLASKNHSFIRIGTLSIAGSLLFFLITNFAVWSNGLLYPLDFSGLTACFIAAIPFFHYTLSGDLVFNGLIFGSFYLVKNYFPVFSKNS
jgi:hypothetical protein